MRGLVLRWVLNALSILLVATIFRSGVQVDSVGAALVAAMLLGILNAIIRPIIVLFTLPINLVTLGLFSLVINGFMLAVVSSVVKGFHVSGFFGAILGALLISVVSMILNGLVKDNK